MLLDLTVPSPVAENSPRTVTYEEPVSNTHPPLDRAIDASRNDTWRNRSTGRGISTCMGDKHLYEGFRVADLLSDRVRSERLVYLLERGNARLRALGAEPVDVAAAASEVESWIDFLRPLVCDTAKLLRDANAAGQEIVLEGAQAALLDVDFGTYPFVSTSNCGVGGVPAGTGLPLRAVDKVIAVAKAYITRVGAGPLPTRDTGPVGKLLQERGNARLRALGAEPVDVAAAPSSEAARPRA